MKKHHIHSLFKKQQKKQEENVRDNKTITFIFSKK